MKTICVLKDYLKTCTVFATYSIVSIQLNGGQFICAIDFGLLIRLNFYVRNKIEGVQGY